MCSHSLLHSLAAAHALAMLSERCNHHHPLQRSSPHRAHACSPHVCMADWRRAGSGRLPKKPSLHSSRCGQSMGLKIGGLREGTAHWSRTLVWWEWSSRADDSEKVRTSRPSFLLRRRRRLHSDFMTCHSGRGVLLGRCTNRVTCADLVAQAFRSAHELPTARGTWVGWCCSGRVAALRA